MHRGPALRAIGFEERGLTLMAELTGEGSSSGGGGSGQTASGGNGAGGDGAGRAGGQTAAFPHATAALTSSLSPRAICVVRRHANGAASRDTPTDFTLRPLARWTGRIGT